MTTNSGQPVLPEDLEISSAIIDEALDIAMQAQPGSFIQYKIFDVAVDSHIEALQNCDGVGMNVIELGIIRYDKVTGDQFRNDLKIAHIGYEIK